MSSYNLNELLDLKNDILKRCREVPNNGDKDNIELKKELKREYGKIQMKLKYYSNEDYRKAKCDSVKAYNKAHVEAYNLYQKNWQRLKNKK